MRILLVLCFFILSACSVLPQNKDALLAISCRSYAATLTVLSVYKDKLVKSQLEVVNSAILIISPLCRKAALGILVDVRDAIQSVNRELERIMQVERGIKL